MAGQDIKKRLNPGQPQQVNVGGDYIFLKFADRPVDIVITGGRSGGTRVTMEAGDKYRPGRFDSFEVQNTDPDRPAQIILTVGEGDYNRQIVQGQVSTLPTVIRADGTQSPDTRYPICFTAAVTDDTVKEVMAGELFNEYSADPFSDQSAFIRNGVVYFPKVNPAGLIIDRVQVSPFKVLGRITVDSEWTDGGVVNPYFKYSEKNDLVYGFTVNGGISYSAVTFDQFLSGRIGAVQNIQSDYQGFAVTKWGVSDNGYIEFYVDNLEDDNLKTVLRFDAQGDLKDEIETPYATFNALYLGDGRAIAKVRENGDVKTGWIDPETLAFIEESDVPENFPTNEAGYDRINRQVIYYRNNNQTIYVGSIEDYRIGGYLTVITGGDQFVKTDQIPIFEGTTIQNLAGYKYTAKGQIIRTLLTAYFLKTEGKLIGEEYLDHVFGLEISNGRKVISGSYSFFNQAIADNFEITLPVDLKLTVDNNLPRG